MKRSFSNGGGDDTIEQRLLRSARHLASTTRAMVSPVHVPISLLELGCEMIIR